MASGQTGAKPDVGSLEIGQGPPEWIEKDIRRIVSALPQQRQSCLFSATMPREVASLADGLLREPVRVEIERKEETAPKIEQFVHHLPQSGKQSLLLSMLQDDVFSRVIVGARPRSI